MITKTTEYWLVLAAMAAYLLFKANRDTFLSRLTKTTTSVVLTLGISTEVSEYLGVSDKVAALLVMAAGLLILDAATSIISDKDFLRDFINKKLGKK